MELQSDFGLENLLVADRPRPSVGPGQVLVRMQAASLNYRDLLMVRGHYNPKQPLPLIPCSDGSGIVESVGEGVTSVEPGQRVATVFAPRWIAGRPIHAHLRHSLGGPLDGTLAEVMLLEEHGVIPVPDHLTHLQASTLTCAGLTAWSAVATLGRVKAGDTVLVQGTGGVSLFALQFANLLGARVIVTSSSNQKLERAKELGSWREINYKENPDWGAMARELTGGVGVDHVVEVGGAGTLEGSLQAVRMGGSISVIGVLAGVKSELNILPILMNGVRLQGIQVGSRSAFETMNRAIDHHQMEPVVDSVYGLEEAPAAFAHMASGRHFGKVCLEIAP